MLIDIVSEEAYLHNIATVQKEADNVDTTAYKSIHKCIIVFYKFGAFLGQIAVCPFFSIA
jgi:hypothetical protein